MSENKPLLRRAFDLVWGAVVLLYRVIVIASLLLGLGLLWMVLRSSSPVMVEDNVALVLAPSGVLVEQIDIDPGQQFFENITGEMPSQSNLHDLIEALDAAREDERIRLAVLKLDGLWSAGLAQLDELRAAMRAFQAAGKPIVAWGPWYDQAHYYAAAQADEISLDPYGMVYIEGFSVYHNYYAEAIEKIGIDMNVFRVGAFKSAVEPFTRNDMSDEARMANREWLGDLWTAYSAAVAEGRGLAPDAADRYVDGLRAGLEALGGDAAAYARDQSLVTRLENLTEFRARIGETVGFDEDHGSFRQIHYLDYLNAVRGAKKVSAGKRAKKVALVVVQGEIVDGPGEPGQAGGDTIFELLDEARRDETVAAVVLRIDSPGGSVWAAEQIRRGVRNLQAAGKPVVASMSSVAASGGYWVAMDADQIWGHETTITGSIGVFGLVPTFDGTLNKLGIHTDGVGTTRLAGAFRLDRPLGEDARAIIQSGIEKVYRDFIEGVAAGRELDLARVDEIAQGRVWSGADARALGLIDHFGGRRDAADAAATLAGLALDAYVLDERRPARGFTAEILSRFSGRVSSWVPAPWRTWFEGAQARVDLRRVLAAFNDPNGQYAHCFCGVEGGRARR
ncbi:signal peptide peptidase SppA [Sinimarinibacterium thermocellulolyticum]|uniref:Signal peptide peptidase SppA n=1 Tax=Sinimarinibacterium thermocellulolyticum TaxID=3170016 RepID=A0ABV2AAB8_9GAMM